MEKPYEALHYGTRNYTHFIGHDPNHFTSDFLTHLTAPGPSTWWLSLGGDLVASAPDSPWSLWRGVGAARRGCAGHSGLRCDAGCREKAMDDIFLWK